MKLNPSAPIAARHQLPHFQNNECEKWTNEYDDQNIECVI